MIQGIYDTRRKGFRVDGLPYDLLTIMLIISIVVCERAIPSILRVRDLDFPLRAFH